VSIARMNLSELLESLGEKTPTPGGGAATGMTAATAAALALMVVRFSRGKNSLAAHEGMLRNAEAMLDRSRTEFLRLADADAAAYEALHALWRLGEDDPKRQAEIPLAARGAIAVPHEVMERCDSLAALLEELVGRTSRSLASDLAIAAILTDAAARGAAWNVRVNLPLLSSRTEARRVAKEAGEVRRRVRKRCGAVEKRCRESK